MPSNRREFIEHLGAAAMLGALPLTSPEFGAAAMVPPQGAQWDLSWVDKLKGTGHKALFDCTEIENGYGIYRASFWDMQYTSAMNVRPADMRTVLILRHHAVAMALRQELWDKLAIGKAKSVKAPFTEQPTDKNPALITEGVPPIALDLPKFIARGGIALACNLALQEWVAALAAKDGVDMAEAQKRIAAGIVSGVTLQPSGVFAAVRAGEAGCVYVKAS